MYTKKVKINPAYVSKHKLRKKSYSFNNSTQRWMERWNYIAVKQLPALLTGITTKHHIYFYCVNFLHSFRTENKLKSHPKVGENKDFRNTVMPSEDTKILKFNQCQKSNKAPFIIYANLECLLEKTDGCLNNPGNSSTTKVGEHITSGFSMSTISSLKSIENKHGVYRGKDCMKKFADPYENTQWR